MGRIMQEQEEEVRIERERAMAQRQAREVEAEPIVETSGGKPQSNADATFDSLDADPELAKYIAIAQEIQKETDDEPLERVSVYVS
jgi:hypothetical protein